MSAMDPDRCWLFQGAKTGGGYGKIWAWGKLRLAHRVAHVELKGPVPDDALVLHTCDVRACCNPAHLYVGSHKDNHRDALARGRRDTFKVPRGEAHFRAALNSSKIKTIRKLSSQGWTGLRLAAKYRVTSGTIYSVLHNRTWRHVK